MPRGLHRIISAARDMEHQDAPASAARRGTEPAHVIREDTFATATTIPDVVSGTETEASKTLGSGWTTGLLIQFLVLAALILAATFFFWQRNRRRRAEAQRKALLKDQHAHMFGAVMVPKGHVPPSYHDAAYSPYLMADNSHVSDHQKLMDDCMRAAYDAEDGIPTTGPADQRKQQQQQQQRTTNDMLMDDCMRAAYDAEDGVAQQEPTSPRGAALGDAGRSVSRWFRNRRWVPGTSANPGQQQQDPLASEHDNAPSSPSPGSSLLPAAPSPSYAGIPSTPGSARSPYPGHQPLAPHHQRQHLAPLVSPYPAGAAASPLPSATSWMTGDDRLSIRASIPYSVLYPSPLQPAPPGRRRTSAELRDDGAGGADSRMSVSSASEYGAATWRTMTPHEDPPEYEPRRGRAEDVSPVREEFPV